MFLKITRSGPRQYLQLVEAFRDDAGKAKHRTLVTLGRLDQITDSLNWPRTVELGGDGSLSEKTVQRLYHAARQRAGLPAGGGIHTLRHCFATHLLEAGKPLIPFSDQS